MDRFRDWVWISLEARIVTRDALSMGYGQHSVMFTRHADGPLVHSVNLFVAIGLGVVYVEGKPLR
jgi:hypothetical protein